MNLYRLLILPCLLTTCMFASAQQGISGKVFLQTQEPAALVTVVLSGITDTGTRQTVLSDAGGLYHLPSISKGLYRIRFSLSGYQAIVIDSVDFGGASLVLEPVYLLPGTQTLEGVKVSSKKPLIVKKIDRTIVNVDALISAAGSNALEVLEKSPGVQVDQNGAISLQGKQGVTIFIDDKPTYLSGDDLANYLRSLPASSLEQIELMTNPPARYDAAGNGGVINIRTKKIRQRGWNGGLTLGLTQGKRFRNNTSANFNFRKDKLTVYANLNYVYNNSFTDLDLYRTYKNADQSNKAFFEQNSFFNRKGNSYSLRAGADFSQNANTTWGIGVNSMLRNSEQLNDNTSNLLGPARQKDSIIVARNFDKIRFDNVGLNLNYRHQFDKNGQGITADADFITYRNRTAQDYANTIYNPDGSIRYNDKLTGNLPNNIEIYTLKTDYTKPLTRSVRFDAGAKESFAQTDNVADYTLTRGSITAPDYDKSNHFIYKENILAAYINFSWETTRLSLQAGLRGEHTNSDGTQLGNPVKPDSSFNRNYTNLFPTIYATYKFDSTAKHQVGLNYGKRIDRPYYQDLNPFLNPMDKFTYYTGNPFLRPAFTQSVELSYIYRNRITTSFSYSKTNDNFNETIRIVDGIYYSSPGNIGQKEVKTISVNASLDPYPWLNINIYSEFGHIHSKGAFFNGTLDTKGSYWYIGPNLRFNFGKGWNGELSGNYRSRLTNAQFIVKELWTVNLGMQKKISTRLNVKLAVTDLFYSRQVRGIINNLALAEASWLNKSDSRFAGVTLSYSFGKAFAQKKYESSGADSEINRVRN